MEIFNFLPSTPSQGHKRKERARDLKLQLIYSKWRWKGTRANKISIFFGLYWAQATQDWYAYSVKRRFDDENI